MKHYILLLFLIFSCTPSEPEDNFLNSQDQECIGTVECNEEEYVTLQDEDSNDYNYHCGDLNVLQQFIDLNSQSIPFRHYLDNNENGCIEPHLEFGYLVWHNGRLIQLNLNYNEDVIMQQDNPTQLDATNYRLTVIPDNIGDLDALESLFLHDNEFTSIPVSIGNITKLKIWDIETNFITDLPDAIGNLINLEQLVLNYNQLTDLPETIGNLSSLDKLFIHHNNLHTLPGSIGNLNQLVWLYLNNNSLDSIPETISDLENLQVLNLDNNVLSTLPENFCDIASELSFSINNNSLCPDVIPDCAFGDTGSQSCTDCPPHYFVIEGQCINQSDYNILQNFLDLNPASQALPAHTGIPNSASDCVNPEWWEDGRLIEISFQHKELTSIIPQNFGDLHKLEILRLTDNEITGEIPSGIMNLDRLKILKLSSNNIGGNIPYNIGVLSNLDTLDLDNNDFDGDIPTSITEIDSLTYVDLGSNKIHGTIPTNIGAIDSLKYLYLENNQLSGTIPPSIGNLTKLKRLYLHNNNLTGQIPSSICTLYSNNETFRLMSFNNQFCPPYPDCIPENHYSPDTQTCQ